MTYKELNEIMTDCELTQADIAKALNCSRANVSNLLSTHEAHDELSDKNTTLILRFMYSRASKLRMWCSRMAE